eukprot:2292309-Lingulodinium_polyedra.AAC.1
MRSAAPGLDPVSLSSKYPGLNEGTIGKVRCCASPLSLARCFPTDESVADFGSQASVVSDSGNEPAI